MEQRCLCSEVIASHPPSRSVGIARGSKPACLHTQGQRHTIQYDPETEPGPEPGQKPPRGWGVGGMLHHPPAGDDVRVLFAALDLHSYPLYCHIQLLVDGTTLTV